MSLLLVQERTERDLADRLTRAGFSDGAVSYAIAYVKGFGYVDDLRFAENYLEFRKGRYSRKELRYKMMGKGVPEEIIREAFQGYGEEDELAAAVRQLEKGRKGRNLEEMDKRERDKLVAHMARKGYPLPIIRRAMQEMAE